MRHLLKILQDVCICIEFQYIRLIMDCIFQKTIFLGNNNAKLFFDFQNMRKRSCFVIVCRVSGLQRILGWSGMYVRLPIRLC